MKSESLFLIQSDLDDETPENLSMVSDALIEKGALDCVRMPVLMKKGRQAVRIEVLSTKENVENFGKYLLRNTSTIGYRVIEVERVSLERREITVDLNGHSIRCKGVFDGKEFLRCKAEHDDCVQAAVAADSSLQEIKREAEQLGRQQFTQSP